MSTHTNEKFENESVNLDGRSFRSCRFNNVTLIYSGGTPPSMSDCEFYGSKFTFDGAAANTTGFLKAMAQDPGMRAVVSQTFPEVFGH